MAFKNNFNMPCIFLGGNQQMVQLELQYFQDFMKYLLQGVLPNCLPSSFRLFCCATKTEEAIPCLSKKN